MSKNPEVLILIGSDSDLPVIKPALEMLEKFDVPHEIEVSSAHRSPKRTADLAGNAEKRGIKVLIIGAGMAAHLAGVVASETILPVIGVPIDSSSLKGVDALYATVQMPNGIPVATMAIGSAGAANAAILATQILALSNESLRKKLYDFKDELEKKVEKKSAALKEKLK